ncbi:unnamed protein product, partial [Oppiella nova]
RASDRVIIETFSNSYSRLYALYATENLADVWTDITETLKKVDKLLAKRRGNEKFLSGASLPGLVDYAVWPFIERIPQF